MDNQTTVAADGSENTASEGQVTLGSFGSGGEVGRKTVPPHKNPRWLRKQYHTKGKSIPEIAVEAGVPGAEIVNRIHEFGISFRGPEIPIDAVRKLSTEDWLREQYVEERRTTTDIADEVGVGASTIGRWLGRHDIEIRSTWETMLPEEAVEKLQDEDWLREQYVKQRRIIADIADELDVGHSTLCRWLEKHDIEKRSHLESEVPAGAVEKLRDEEWLREQYVKQRRSMADIGDEVGVSGHTVGEWLCRHDIESRSGSKARLPAGVAEKLRDEQWVRKQYVKKRRTAHEIASELDVGDTTVHRWLHRHGIETRSDVERKIPAEAVEKLQDEGWVKEQYVEQRRTTYEIGDELGVVGGTVGRWMEKHGIEKRSNFERKMPAEAVEKLQDEGWVKEQYVEQRRSAIDIANGLGVSIRPIFSALERHGIEKRSLLESKLPAGVAEKLQDEDWLREQYVEQRRTTGEIGDDLDVYGSTVSDWLERHGIETRSGIRDPEHLDHLVRSEWEFEIANLLRDNGVEYEYEALEINWVDDRVYTPDFVTEDYVIEVKGQLFDGKREDEKARAALQQLDDRDYVVVGTKLPCDIHIPWDDRERLVETIEHE